MSGKIIQACMSKHDSKIRKPDMDLRILLLISKDKKHYIKVKCMQRSGTEAIRTQLQPSKPKREISNIRNSQNTKRTYGQPSE